VRATAPALGAITRVTTDDKVVALTFDEGPDPVWTPRLLEVFDRFDAKATFFWLGQFAKDHPEVVRQAAEAGHTIANHSFDHPSFPLVSRQERRRQVLACAAALEPYQTRLFRSPYGNESMASRLQIRLMGYQVINWDIVGYDYLEHDAEWMAGQMVGEIRPGSIVLLHDRILSAPEPGCFNREPMVESVRMVLERLGSEYRFVTVPELLEHGKPERSTWYSKPDVEWLNTLKEPGGGGRRYGLPTHPSAEV